MVKVQVQKSTIYEMGCSLICPYEAVNKHHVDSHALHKINDYFVLSEKVSEHSQNNEYASNPPNMSSHGLKKHPWKYLVKG